MRAAFKNVRFFNNKLDLSTFYRAWAFAVLTACMGVPPAAVVTSASQSTKKEDSSSDSKGSSSNTQKKPAAQQFKYSPRPAAPGRGWGSWNGRPIEGDEETEKEYAARSSSGYAFGVRIGGGASGGSSGKPGGDGADLTPEDWTPVQPAMIPATGVPKSTDPGMLRTRLLGTMENCNPLMELAGYEPMVIEDFQAEFQMAVLSIDTMTLEQLLGLVEDKHRIMSVSVFLKTMTGVGLYQKRQQLESFCKLRDSKLGLTDYRAKYVDSIKAEATVLEVVATVAAWSIPVQVYSWDELVGKPVVVGGGSYTCPAGFKGKPVVNLLWRDGEYGVLETF